MRDPFQIHIGSLLTAGLLVTGFSMAGYLHEKEAIFTGGVYLQYPSYLRKIPLSVLGSGLCLSAYLLSQDRKQWKTKLAEWKIEAKTQRAYQDAILRQAQHQGLTQLAQLKVAERLYPSFQPYLDTSATPVQQALAPAQPQPQPQPQPDPGIGPGGFNAVPGGIPATPVQSAPIPAMQPQPVYQAPVPGGIPGGTVPAQAVSPEFKYLDLFIEYPGLVFGGQGSGKTSTQRLIAQKKRQAGHRVVLLDPHGSPQDCGDVELIGAGMDYSAIAKFLCWYMDEIAGRYSYLARSGLSEAQWQEDMRRNGRVISVICEELTNWADRCGNISEKFMKCALTDSRKALMPPLLVSHNRTLSCIGDVKGMAQMRDSSLLELELIPKIDDYTGQPTASGNGRLKYPGNSSWIDIRLPPGGAIITPPPATTAPPAAPPATAPVDRLSAARDLIQACWEQTSEDDEPTIPDVNDRIQNSGDRLPEHLQPLLNYARKNAGKKLSASDVKRSIRSYSSISAEDIRRMFYQLVGIGVGNIDGSGSQAVYWVDN